MPIFTGCSGSRETMRGSAVMKIDDEAHISIGSDDGIKVGDTLTVYRTIIDARAGDPDNPQTYRTLEAKDITVQKLRVGEVKVIRIFNEHYSAVKLLEGLIADGDIVEKSARP
jgi:hypothetical protein